jgi:hypothetical protein
MEYWGGCSVMSKHANEVGGSDKRRGKSEKGKGKTIALQTLQVQADEGWTVGQKAKINKYPCACHKRGFIDRADNPKSNLTNDQLWHAAPLLPR